MIWRGARNPDTTRWRSSEQRYEYKPAKPMSTERRYVARSELLPMFADVP